MIEKYNVRKHSWAHTLFQKSYFTNEFQHLYFLLIASKEIICLFAKGITTTSKIFLEYFEWKSHKHSVWKVASSSSTQLESDLSSQQQAGHSENADFNYKLYSSMQFTVYTWCVPPYELSEQLPRRWV